MCFVKYFESGKKGKWGVVLISANAKKYDAPLDEEWYGNLSGLLGSEEEWDKMPVKEVHGHILADDLTILHQHPEILASHFGCYFVADVKQLPEMKIVTWIRLCVPQR